MNNNGEVAYALLRSTLGSIFLTAGLVKLTMGTGDFAAILEQQFAGKLPMSVVTPFAHALPSVEMAIGTLLVWVCSARLP